MEIGQAVRYVFDDEQWLGKLLIGAVISLIPVFGGLAVTGYAIAVLRNVKAGIQYPLPSWDRLGEYFVDGLMIWIGTFIYSIPLLIFICPLALVWVLPAIAGDNQDLTAVLSGVAGVISLGLGCLSLLYGILLWVLTAVLQIRYAEIGKIGPLLRFGEVFGFLFDHIGSILIAQLLVAVAGIIVSTLLGGLISVFSLIPICGWIAAAILSVVAIPVGVWVLLFAAHLYAQIAGQPEVAPAIL